MNYYKVDALSNSAIKYLKQSALHYKNWLNEPQKDTPALIFGRALHCYVLEPHKFNDYFFMEKERPEGADGRAKKGTKEKQLYDNWVASNVNENNLPTISNETMMTIAKMTNIINAKLAEIGYENFDNLEFEKELYFNYKGVDCKAKLDIFDAKSNIIFDIKTIESCSDNSILRAVINNEYYRQAEWYKLACKETVKLEKKPDFKFIFIEKKAPYDCRIVTLNEDFERAGIVEYNTLIERFKYMNNWSDNSGRGDLHLTMPPYMDVLVDA